MLSIFNLKNDDESIIKIVANHFAVNRQINQSYYKVIKVQEKVFNQPTHIKTSNQSVRVWLTGSVHIALAWEARARKARPLNSTPLKRL